MTTTPITNPARAADDFAARQRDALAQIGRDVVTRDRHLSDLLRLPVTDVIPVDNDGGHYVVAVDPNAAPFPGVLWTVVYGDAHTGSWFGSRATALLVLLDLDKGGDGSGAAYAERVLGSWDAR